MSSEDPTQSMRNGNKSFKQRRTFGKFWRVAKLASAYLLAVRKSSLSLGDSQIAFGIKYNEE